MSVNADRCTEAPCGAALRHQGAPHSDDALIQGGSEPLHRNSPLWLKNDVSASSHQPGCSRCMHRSSTRGKMSDSVWSHWVDVSFQFPLRIQLLDVFQAPVHILLKTKLLLRVLIFCKQVKSFSRNWKLSFWETFPGWRYSETPSSVLMCRQGFLIVRQSSDWSTWPYSRGHISTCFLACAWQPTFAF